jgi:hypothetical protein
LEDSRSRFPIIIVVPKTDAKLMLMRSFSSKMADTHSRYDLYLALEVEDDWMEEEDDERDWDELSVSARALSGIMSSDFEDAGAAGVVAGVAIAVALGVVGDATDGVIGVATGAIGVGTTAVVIGVVTATVVDEGRTGVSAGGELGADDVGRGTTVGDAHEGGVAGEALVVRAAAAAMAAFMFSSLFSNHWYNLLRSTGTRVSIKVLHFSSIATSFISLAGITGGGGGRGVEGWKMTEVMLFERVCVGV